MLNRNKTWQEQTIASSLVAVVVGVTSFATEAPGVN